MEAQFFGGQTVKITANHAGHGHPIGAKVKLKRAKRDESMLDEYWHLESAQWVFSSEDCEPLNHRKGAF